MNIEGKIKTVKYELPVFANDSNELNKRLRKRGEKQCLDLTIKDYIMVKAYILL